MAKKQAKQSGERKSVYLTAADARIAQRFEKSGGNFSELFREGLLRWDSEERRRAQAQKQKMDEISVDIDGVEKVFTGRWLVEPNESPDLIPTGVAATRRGQFVLVHGDTPGVDEFRVFEVCRDLDALERFVGRAFVETAEDLEVGTWWEGLVRRAKAAYSEINPDYTAREVLDI